MTTLNFGTSVSLSEAASLVAHNPEMRFLLQGEPGCGKSSILPLIGKMLPDHELAYVDVPVLDLGDVAMPAVNHTQRITEYYPNGRFKLHTGKPVVIMLDEFTKGMDPVKNMLHPLLETSNPRLGDVPLPRGSVVFLTGNQTSDGVGDVLKAHSRNRLATVTVRKPSADEWLLWAVENGVDPVVCAWVRQYPHALDPIDYTAERQDNPYIFNPKAAQKAFVSPRSLERVSYAVARRQHYPESALLSAMIGAIGEAGARDMQAYVAYQDQLPSWDAIIKDPAHAAVPKDPGACAVLVYGAVAKVDRDTVSPFMEYVSRMESEWQAVFAITTMKTPSKVQIVVNNKSFNDWLLRNSDILV